MFHAVSSDSLITCSVEKLLSGSTQHKAANLLLIEIGNIGTALGRTFVKQIIEIGNQLSLLKRRRNHYISRSSSLAFIAFIKRYPFIVDSFDV